MIEARGLTVRRQGRAILSDVDIDVCDGEVLGLVGPNGSGKTTLLRCLFGACTTDAGTVALDGTSLRSMSARAIAQRVAVVPQAQPAEIDQTVSEVVALGRLPHQGWFSSTSARDEASLADALNRVGLMDKSGVKLSRLSGGERQRVLIARALVQEADHLLLDEPTNHLDLGYQHDILRFVRDLRLATMVVLHDLNLAMRYCDRIALLDGGCLIATGPAQEVLRADRIAEIYRVPTERIVTPSGRTHLLFADTSHKEMADD